MTEDSQLIFDPFSYGLLDEVTSGDKLQFKSPKTGAIYDAKPEHTLLAGEEQGQLYALSKYRNTLLVTAYNPINPRARIEAGCEKCKRKIVSYQSLGAEKRVFYVCLCGNQWTN